VLVGGPERIAEALTAYRDAGADWVILGPIDSSDADNAAVLGERVAPLLA
jgi:alkanesulfonate monooxygenase SsuD/methylene tetrahydromethanopterin reductase-like flavin-dependent oxidoreductase (luciferase family)